MSVRNQPIRSRLVSSAGGRKVFSVDCGGDVCTGLDFGARLVDTGVRGRKVFAMASECLHRPSLAVPLEFVHIDCNPPWGIPTTVKLKLQILNPDLDSVDCWGKVCPTAYLTYDPIDDVWKGSITVKSGTIDVEFFCAFAPTSGTYEFFVRLIGDCLTGGGTPPTQTYPIVRECIWPFKASEDWPVPGLLTACCGGVTQSTHTFSFTVYGVTLDRYIARLVDSVFGRKVFALKECCPPLDCEVDADCCGCEANPAAWTFSVAGVSNGTCLTCAQFNGSWTISYVGSCRWEADHAGICTPGSPWFLTCDGIVWRLSTTNFNGAATYELAVGDWKCFGPNIMTRVSDHTPGCTGFPGTITLLAA